MTIWVAYNSYGDLVAEGMTYEALLAGIFVAGYESYEVFIGRVTP